MDDQRLDLNTLSRESFGALIEPYRRELQAHCYRMMGTVHDAQDMVQETFLRAWRRRDTYEGRASVRAWLYKIATNACLDILKKHPRRHIPRTRGSALSLDEPIPADINDPIWLEPYPDDPAIQVQTRDQIRLAFIAALHVLPPRQRAILLLNDVLDWQLVEIAAQLDTTISAVKSALHRARTALAEHSRVTTTTPMNLSPTQLDAYMRAWEHADIDAFVQMLTDEATFSMPPIPAWYQGRETIRSLIDNTIFAGQASGRWRMLPTRANDQPAFGLYRLNADGKYVAYGIQVTTLVGNSISDVITFRVPSLFDIFGLPLVID